MKKKKLAIASVILLIVCFIIVAAFFVIKNKDHKKLIHSIKNRYSEYVTLPKDSDLYAKVNEEYKKAGIGYHGAVFKLSSIEINSSEDKYFNIAGSDYYVYYKDVQPVNERIINDRYQIYVDFNYNIVTKKAFTIYIDDKKMMDINQSLTFPIKYRDENNYYIEFNDMLVRIANEDVEETLENTNSDIRNVEKISVLNYADIMEECASTRCITKKQFEEQVQFLNDNEYITITLEEYNAWLNGHKRLPNKSILIVVDNISEYVEDMTQKNNIMINNLKGSDLKLFLYNFASTNESKRSAIPAYRILSSTDIEIYAKMVIGEKLATETSDSAAKSIAVLNYHFLYEPSKGETCYPSICLDEKEFRRQMQYLQDNGFKTLTMEEFRAWMYGEIELPKKSVLLTFDDGYVGNLISIMEELDMQATIFSITAWHEREKFVSDNISIESHGHDIHHEGFCKGVTRGAKALCISREELLLDLKISIERVESNIAFCYPFWVVNNYLKDVVKEAGFHLAFGVGYNKATRDSDKYNIPRYVIYNRTSLNEFIGMVK